MITLDGPKVITIDLMITITDETYLTKVKGTLKFDHIKQLITLTSDYYIRFFSRLSHIQDNSITATCSVCFRGFRKLEYLRNHEKRVHFRPPNARGRHVGKKRTKVKPPGASKSTTRGKKTTQVVVGEISQPRQGQSVNTLHIGSPVTLATLNSSNVIHNQFYMD